MNQVNIHGNSNEPEDLSDVFDFMFSAGQREVAVNVGDVLADEGLTDVGTCDLGFEMDMSLISSICKHSSAETSTSNI